jgi:nitrite reductase/ring-hydroxylating ferredoxin subunit
MATPGVKRNIIQRIFGICATKPPADQGCWRYDNGSVVVSLSSAAELTRENGAIRLEGKGMPERVLVFRGNDGQYRALRNKCEHMGRRLDPVPGAPRIECCSIGGSSYDYQGKVLSGLAKGKVPVFPVAEEEGELSITLEDRGDRGD